MTDYFVKVFLEGDYTCLYVLLFQMINDTPHRDEDEVPAFDIPIFTEEFLDHNKAREAELRQLRKQNTEYEEQNAILSKHIENMKQAIEKLEVEAVQQRSNNIALQQHLDGLRTTLTANFSSVALPGMGFNHVSVMFLLQCSHRTWKTWNFIMYFSMPGKCLECAQKVAKSWNFN